MTRKEALDELENLNEGCYFCGSIEKLLVEVYDYFEQRIAELEASKTCDGCKHNRFGNGSCGIAVECTLMGNIGACIRGVVTDYYEPKD